MTLNPDTAAKLRPLVAEAYWAAKTAREERLVSVLMGLLGMADPYTHDGGPLRGRARG